MAKSTFSFTSLLVSWTLPLGDGIRLRKRGLVRTYPRPHASCRLFALALSFCLMSASDSATPQTKPQPAVKAVAQGGQGDPWWKHAVIYEVYPRSFQDSKDDGVGDIQGITSRLNYL